MNKTIQRLAIIPVLALSGCVGTALRIATTDYSEEYADAVNRQLLLNLARLSHDEPPYFVQVGQMNSQFTFSSAAGLNIANTQAPVSTDSHNAFTYGGNIGGGVVSSPTFQMVPLNGEAFAQANNSPIPKNLFWTLFDQGFHADLIVRTLVKAIRVHDPKNYERVVLTLDNHPYSSEYPQFLEFCAALRQAQISDELILKPDSSTNAAVYRDPKLGDVIAAMGAGFVITNTELKSSAAGTKPNPPGTEKPGSSGGTNQASDKLDYVMSWAPKTYTLKLPDYGTSSVEDLVNNPAILPAFKFNPVIKRALLTGNLEFQPRTFLAAMYAVGKEEVYFKRCLNNPPPYATDNLKFKQDEDGFYIENSTNGTVVTHRAILTLSEFSPEQRARLTVNEVFTRGLKRSFIQSVISKTTRCAIRKLRTEASLL